MMDTSSSLEILEYLSRVEANLKAQMSILNGKLLDIREMLTTTSEEIRLLRQEIAQLSGMISHL